MNKGTVFLVTLKLSLCYYFMLHIYTHEVNLKDGSKVITYIYIKNNYMYIKYMITHTHTQDLAFKEFRGCTHIFHIP